MKRLLLAVMLLGLVNKAFSQDTDKFDVKTIMQKLQKQVLAPIATSCVEMKTFEKNSLNRTFVFRRGYFYGLSGGGIKEKIFLDFVYPPELSKLKYFLVEDESGNREKELLWTSSQRRTRRINNANQAYMQASDYYFYDLLDHINEEGWEYFLTGKEENIFTIEAKFAGKPKVYGRLTIKTEEIAPGIFIYKEIIFYDERWNLFKKEKYFNFKHVWDIYYRPDSMVMENLSPRQNTKTEIRFRHWEVRPIKDEDLLVFEDLYLKLEKDLPIKCSEKDFE